MKLILFPSYMLVEFTGKASLAWDFLWGKVLCFKYSFVRLYQVLLWHVGSLIFS